MSFDLPDGAVESPYLYGMREGMNLDDDGQFFYTAYRHPHGPTWFGGSRRRAGRLSEYGVWIHYITSSVNILRIPAKTDDKVAAINYDMFVELVRAEYEFWDDYNHEHARLVGAWGQVNHPGVLVEALPEPPRNLHVMAIKYAHRQVAIRAGKENELPDDFDAQEFVEEVEELDWDE